MAYIFKTKKKRKNYCYEKGKGFTVGFKYTLLFPEGLILQLLLAGKTFDSFLLDGILKHFFSFSWFSLNSNWLKKICPANRIQSVNWTYQIGLSIQDKETRTKLLLWKRERHHFGCCLNSFLKDWFSNCYWLGRHSIPSKWME